MSLKQLVTENEDLDNLKKIHLDFDRLGNFFGQLKHAGKRIVESLDNMKESPLYTSNISTEEKAKFKKR